MFAKLQFMTFPLPDNDDDDNTDDAKTTFFEAFVEKTPLKGFSIHESPMQFLHQLLVSSSSLHIFQGDVECWKP